MRDPSKLIIGIVLVAAAIIILILFMGCTSSDVNREYRVELRCEAEAVCLVWTELLLEDLKTDQQTQADGADVNAEADVSVVPK